MSASELNEAHSANVDARAVATAQGSSSAGGGATARVPARAERLERAAAWALEHFAQADKANAAMHMAPVKFSPITFELAHGLDELGSLHGAVVRAEVLAHAGRYELDGGR